MADEHRITSGVAVVTGAGAGLGRALAITLANKGLEVAGIGRSAAPLQDLSEELDESFLPVTADVADPASVTAAMAQITAKWGTPDILINNAAVYPHRDILDETPESFAQTMDINLGGVLHCCLAVLPDMIARGHGRIVNISTFADVAPAPTAAAYSVSKGAARILTRALIADLGDRFPDIVINDWIPGALRTQMGIPEGIAPEDAAQWGARLATWRDPMLTGRVFDRDTEVLAPLSAKRKLLNRLTGRRQTPLRLS